MKISLLTLLLSLSWLTQAQVPLQSGTHQNYPLAYQRGMWLVGLQAGHSSAQLIGKNLTAHVYGGYFVANKLLLGLQGTRIQEGLTLPVYDVSYLVGPMLRCQLTRTRISPFIMASCQIGQRTLDQSEPLIATSTSVTVNSSGTHTSTSTSSFYIVNPGTHLIYSRSASIGVSIGVITSLRIDVAVNWQDRVSDLGSKFPGYNGLYQAQFGINYLVGTKPQNSRKPSY